MSLKSSCGRQPLRWVPTVPDYKHSCFYVTSSFSVWAEFSDLPQRTECARCDEGLYYKNMTSIFDAFLLSYLNYSHWGKWPCLWRTLWMGAWAVLTPSEAFVSYTTRNFILIITVSVGRYFSSWSLEIALQLCQHSDNNLLRDLEPEVPH